MNQSAASAWKEWLAENGPRLLLFARGWSNTREDAEDLVQDAIVRMWNHQSDKGHVPPDLPLVFSTIRFCGLNLHRSEKRRRKREESVVYLNDFMDVWLDPAVEEDEEAVILRRGRSEPEREAAGGGNDEDMGRLDVSADISGAGDLAEYSGVAIPVCAGTTRA